MSALSTLMITRTKARELLFEKVCKASDSELEDMIDVILAEKLYNCRIVNDNEDNDNYVLGNI
jgi:hypothetical protein